MLQYIKDVFSSDNCASFSRYSTAITVLTGCWSVIYVVVKTHALPDGASLAGLAVFVVAPYGIKKAADAFGRPQNGGS